MFKKIAQVDPAAPPGGAPPPMPDLGGGGMGGGMDLGLGAAPMGGAPAPAAPTGPKPPIKYPLDKITYILQDADIDQEIMGLNPIGDVVEKLWMMYGGDENGGVDPNKKGERQPFKEVDDSELQATQSERWKRLPLGETLSSLGISMDEFNKAIVAASLSLSKSKSQAGQQGGGALANIKLQNMVKLARILDLNGKYQEADKIFKY